MASQIADHLALKIENLAAPIISHQPGGELIKRGRGRPRKDDKDPKPHTSTTGTLPLEAPLGSAYRLHLFQVKSRTRATGQVRVETKNIKLTEFLTTNIMQTECGMWFSQSSNLNKHYLTHTNEKPFHCLWPNCNKKFKVKIKNKSISNLIQPTLCNTIAKF